jgi:hypothetical protein
MMKATVSEFDTLTISLERQRVETTLTLPAGLCAFCQRNYSLFFDLTVSLSRFEMQSLNREALRFFVELRTNGGKLLRAN